MHSLPICIDFHANFSLPYIKLLFFLKENISNINPAAPVNSNATLFYLKDILKVFHKD